MLYNISFSYIYIYIFFLSIISFSGHSSGRNSTTITDVAAASEDVISPTVSRIKGEISRSFGLVTPGGPSTSGTPSHSSGSGGASGTTAAATPGSPAQSNGKPYRQESHKDQWRNPRRIEGRTRKDCLCLPASDSVNFLHRCHEKKNTLKPIFFHTRIQWLRPVDLYVGQRRLFKELDVLISLLVRASKVLQMKDHWKKKLFTRLYDVTTAKKQEIDNYWKKVFSAMHGGRLISCRPFLLQSISRTEGTATPLSRVFILP